MIIRFVVLLIVLCFSLPARAHDWYDKDCCHNKDCAPITKIEQSGSGLEITTTMSNSLGLTGVVTKYTSFRLSKDKEEHACINKNTNQVICYYGVEKF